MQNSFSTIEVTMNLMQEVISELQSVSNSYEEGYDIFKEELMELLQLDDNFTMVDLITSLADMSLQYIETYSDIFVLLGKTAIDNLLTEDTSKTFENLMKKSADEYNYLLTIIHRVYFKERMNFQDFMEMCVGRDNALSVTMRSEKIIYKLDLLSDEYGGYELDEITH